MFLQTSRVFLLTNTEANQTSKMFPQTSKVFLLTNTETNQTNKMFLQTSRETNQTNTESLQTSKMPGTVRLEGKNPLKTAKITIFQQDAVMSGQKGTG
jgi:hypothetical protein